MRHPEYIETWERGIITISSGARCKKGIRLPQRLNCAQAISSESLGPFLFSLLSVCCSTFSEMKFRNSVYGTDKNGQVIFHDEVDIAFLR